MRQIYGEEAEKRGVSIVSFCGFDSVPADIGAFMLNEYARNKLNKPHVHIKGSYTKLKGGGASGGTIASALLIIDETVRSAFSFKSKRHRKDKRPQHPHPRYWPVHYDSTFGKWQMPWIMAGVNMAVVNLAADKNNYGQKFSYFESCSAPSFLSALLMTFAINLGFLMLAFPPTRWFINKILPSPGKGPTRREIEEGKLVLDLVGMTDDNDEGVVSNKDLIYGRVVAHNDPGYGEASKYVSEGALCLLENKHSKDRSLASKISPGIYPPSVIMGHVFLEHLLSKGFEFIVSDKPFENKKSK